jgi:peptidyl-prolyl cis-trans isomerase SurA
MKKLSASLAIFAIAAPPLSAAIPLNGIAATVNGTVVTRKEVYFHLAPTIGQLQARYPRLGEQYQKEVAKAQNEVLEQLIDNKLVLSKLEELDAKIPDVVIDEEVDRIVREVFNGDEKAFRENLERSGMNRHSFRESQREKILVQVIRQQQFKDVAPASDAEIKAHYNKRHHDLRDRSQDTITFRKIFIPAADPDNPAATPDEQLALAEKLAADVQGGADFAQTAIAHSAGAFAAEGGLWEDEPRPNLEVGFGDIVFDTPEGQIVGPLKDPVGFTTVLVIKKTYGPAPALDKKMKERMRSEVEIEKRAERYDEWLQFLKRSAMIKRNL